MKPNERKLKMKSNLAIIEDNAKFNLAKSDPKPKVQTVAQGVKLPVLKDSNPIFDRPFGKDGHSLGEALEHHASVYKSLVKQRKNQLEKLKDIGLVLLELRSVSGASNKDYGILVSKTPLAIMSRQDRYDALWLAENWTNVQSYMKEMDISSGSAAYLRQKMTKKTSETEPKVQSEAEPKAPTVAETDAKPSAGVQSTEKPAIDEASSIPTEGKTEDKASTEGTTEEVSIASEEDFATCMAEIVKNSGLDLKKVIDALLKLA
jgi:hypothetical protein